jgi:hypothetical protein
MADILDDWESLSKEEQSLRCSLFEAWIDSFQIARPDVYAKVRNN